MSSVVLILGGVLMGMFLSLMFYITRSDKDYQNGFIRGCDLTAQALRESKMISIDQEERIREITREVNGRD